MSEKMGERSAKGVLRANLDRMVASFGLISSPWAPAASALQWEWAFWRSRCFWGGQAEKKGRELKRQRKGGNLPAYEKSWPRGRPFKILQQTDYLLPGKNTFKKAPHLPQKRSTHKGMTITIPP